MAQKTIKDLSGLSAEDFDPNQYWLVVQKGSRVGGSISGATYRMFASAALLETFVDSEYMDIAHVIFSHQGKSLQFDKNNIFSSNSSVDILLEFGSNLLMSSARVIKNSSSSTCTLLTSDGIQDIQVGADAQRFVLSEYTDSNQNKSIVSADVSASTNSFKLTNLKIENETDQGALVSSAYCAAKVKGLVIA
mgnify:CR=1 FL=1